MIVRGHFRLGLPTKAQQRGRVQYPQCNHRLRQSTWETDVSRRVSPSFDDPALFDNDIPMVTFRLLDSLTQKSRNLPASTPARMSIDERLRKHDHPEHQDH